MPASLIQLAVTAPIRVTARRQHRYLSVVRHPAYPVQIVWGGRDRALSLRRYGVQAQLAAGLDDATVLPGKHFLQEEYAPEIAETVYRLAE